MPHLQDESDVVFRATTGKWRAVVVEISRMHKTGRPVLVGTTSVEQSDSLSQQLREAGIPHEVELFSLKEVFDSINFLSLVFSQSSTETCGNWITCIAVCFTRWFIFTWALVYSVIENTFVLFILICEGESRGISLILNLIFGLWI